MSPMTDFRRYIQVLDASGEPLDEMVLVAPSEEVLDRMESDFRASIAKGASAIRVNSATDIRMPVVESIEFVEGV